MLPRLNCKQISDKQMGKIFYLMGKSASGKDTILRRLILVRPSLKKYVMYTTRPIRNGEIEGESYHFVTEKTLGDFKNAGKLIESREYKTVQGNWCYATVDDGQMDPIDGEIITEGTLESYLKVKKYFGSRKVVPLYIEIEDGERLKRALLRERNEKFPDYKELCRRFLADSVDFSEEKLAMAGIKKRFVNDDLDKCVRKILGVMG